MYHVRIIRIIGITVFNIWFIAGYIQAFTRYNLPYYAWKLTSGNNNDDNNPNGLTSNMVDVYVNMFSVKIYARNLVMSSTFNLVVFFGKQIRAMIKHKDHVGYDAHFKVHKME